MTSQLPTGIEHHHHINKPALEIRQAAGLACSASAPAVGTASLPVGRSATRFEKAPMSCASLMSSVSSSKKALGPLTLVANEREDLVRLAPVEVVVVVVHLSGHRS